MKILLDECLPRRLGRDFTDHTVSTVRKMGWAGTKNGSLLRLAETEFEVFVTADRNLEHQQNLKSTTLIFVVLIAPNNKISSLTPLIPTVLKILKNATAGDVLAVSATDIMSDSNDAT